MTRQFQVSESATIGAPAARIYALLRDYHGGHPKILPKQYFASLVIEEGGEGAGTVISVAMTRLGGGQRLRMTVSEPEPGRLLVEEDRDAGLRTTFTVDPLDPVGAEGSRVTIESIVEVADGIAARFQVMVAKPVLRRMFKKQLKMLADLVAAPSH